MEEHIMDLSILAKRYQDRITSLENELNEEKRKFTLVSDAIALLRKEGIFEQKKLFEMPEALSDKYKEMSMTDAVLDILRSAEPEKLSANTIYLNLVKNGFKSNSKKLQSDVYTRLNRLEKKHMVTSTKKKKGHPKRYFLLSKGEEPNQQAAEVGKQ